MDSKKDLVSVVIPCYKQARFLGEAIESVLGQSHEHHEIIVVDDGSPDNAEEVAARYPEVKYLRQRNQGVARARNRGLLQSRGQYTVFLDADDRLLPNNLQEGLKAFRGRPDVARVDGAYRAFTSAGTWYGHNCDYKLDQYGTLLLHGQNLSAVMWKREVVVELGGFRNLKRSQDHDLHVRFAQLYPLYCHHEVVTEHRKYDKPVKWEDELRYKMMMCRSQWDYIKTHPQYKDLFKLAMLEFQQRYGDPLLWQMGAAATAGDWKRAFRYLQVLLRFYPSGFVNHVRGIFSRRLPNLPSVPNGS